MRRLPNPEQPWNAVYEFSDGSRFQADARLVAEIGITVLLKGTELERHLPIKRVPVLQCGKIIGTMAPDFDPLSIKSKNFLYDPRSGDFKLTEEGWIAASQLGPGDFELIPGFVRHAR